MYLKADHQKKVNQIVNGKFSVEDWERIVHALQSYVIATEEILKQHNCGDREWDNLASYSALAKDIELFVLPMEKKQ